MATWSIVLAGGQGTRLASESIRRYGYARPKQFCDFDGRGTLLARTLERALRHVPATRIVVATTRGWEREVDETLSAFPGVLEVSQPVNRDTGPGILLPLLAVLKQDPDARVALLPSDHHVGDDDAFDVALGSALDGVATEPDRVAMLGAVADEPEPGYGWIVPEEGPENWRRVASFREKPPHDEAISLCAAGALLNTFVMAASGRFLDALCKRYMPEWRTALGAGPEHVNAAYAAMPASNFSHDVLEQAVDALRVVPMRGAWSDVGTPERLLRVLEPVATQVA